MKAVSNRVALERLLHLQGQAMEVWKDSHKFSESKLHLKKFMFLPPLPPRPVKAPRSGLLDDMGCPIGV